MKIASPLVLLLSLTGTVPAAAQAPDSPPEPGAASRHLTQAAVGSIAPLFEMVKGYIIASAEQMPAELYSYRPTPEVRTFGEILGHVAMGQYWFCGAASDTPADPDNFEEITDKAEMVAAVRGAFDFCSKAYAMDDAMAMEEMEFFGQTGTRLWVLNFNAVHTWEHYGNLVTYMRANGMVPPSSQGGM